MMVSKQERTDSEQKKAKTSTALLSPWASVPRAPTGLPLWGDHQLSAKHSWRPQLRGQLLLAALLE